MGSRETAPSGKLKRCETRSFPGPSSAHRRGLYSAYPRGNGASYAADFRQRSAVDSVPACVLYGNLSGLFDGSRGGGHRYLLDALRPSGHYYAHPAGWPRHHEFGFAIWHAVDRPNQLQSSPNYCCGGPRRDFWRNSPRLAAYFGDDSDMRGHRCRIYRRAFSHRTRSSTRARGVGRHLPRYFGLQQRRVQYLFR